MNSLKIIFTYHQVDSWACKNNQSLRNGMHFNLCLMPSQQDICLQNKCEFFQVEHSSSRVHISRSGKNCFRPYFMRSERKGAEIHDSEGIVTTLLTSCFLTYKGPQRASMAHLLFFHPWLLFLFSAIFLLCLGKSGATCQGNNYLNQNFILLLLLL